MEDGYVYDVENAEVNLPDTNELLDGILTLLEYMASPEAKQVKLNTPDKYQMHLETKFPNFTNRYFSTFMKLMTGEDITPLLMMLTSISDLNNGKTNIEDVEKSIGQNLMNKYVKPKVDKKKKNKKSK